MNDQNQPPDITAFLTGVARDPRSERTWVAHRSDLNLFARWLTQTTGGPVEARTLPCSAVRDDTHHLLAAKGEAAATLNRRLAALRACCGWAKPTGPVTHDPQLVPPCQIVVA